MWRWSEYTPDRSKILVTIERLRMEGLNERWKKRDLKNKMWWWDDLLYPLRYVKVYLEASFSKNTHHQESCQTISKAIKLASFCMIRALTERYCWTDLDPIWKDLREALYWIWWAGITNQQAEMINSTWMSKDVQRVG